ncbi:glycoside hydrolase family 3 N-terminal domain-containing protein [Qipengyuania nanhaisediminis]|uniref:glycoside hydrolase family 3 protein n=1 Tax=Qipengyuania nanhaisediminis TaxID=604088 RepID=UPI0038B3A750
MATAIAGCSPAPLSTSAGDPSAQRVQAGEDAVVAGLVSRMSLERKVAQLIQPQINSFTAADMERYRFGSYLNGGNGGPYGDEFAPASEWLRLADEMFLASVKPLEGGEPAIPVMWGTDAVHGHTNVVGATIFPHNIALGATGDADLVRRIGAATAVEIEVTGIDWNFSPTVAVARDDRWGRTYESYSENPELVAELGAALVEGQQGVRGSEDYLGTGRVIATAKHFFGDGGTDNGVDQGEVTGDLNALMAIHAVPYPAAIAAGVETIMASFNSINGRKMHGNRALLTDVLRGQMGFDGLVVGDWNGHGQVAGCTVTDCPQSLLAGLDIYMVPDDWKGLMDTLIAQVRDGTIPEERIDEAVTRVLRVKYRAGLLDPDVQRPSQRGVAGRYDLLASPEHRALAREAVAASQVILRNDGVLPLAEGADILVAGMAADNIGIASGGWTLEWQGMTESNDRLFPNATSIWEGLKEATEARGGSATLSPDGSFTNRPDVAVVVFGERPYAEFAGDRKHLGFSDEEGLRLLRQFNSEGVPTVAVFLSGRPLWVNRELNLANAFVASWLPGSEGAGIADILTGAVSARGKLSFSWPNDCTGAPLNRAEGALFPVGYGLATGEISPMPVLGESCSLLDQAGSSVLFGQGRLADSAFAVALRKTGVPADVAALELFRGSPQGTGIAVRGHDRNAQEDSREIAMAAGSAFAIGSNESDARAYRVVYDVPERPAGRITLSLATSGDRGTPIDITQHMAHAAQKGWREMIVTEACAGTLADRALLFSSEAAFTFRIAEVARVEVAEGTGCSF